MDGYPWPSALSANCQNLGLIHFRLSRCLHYPRLCRYYQSQDCRFPSRCRYRHLRCCPSHCRQYRHHLYPCHRRVFPSQSLRLGRSWVQCRSIACLGRAPGPGLRRPKQVVKRSPGTVQAVAYRVLLASWRKAFLDGLPYVRPGVRGRVPAERRKALHQADREVAFSSALLQ